MSSQNVSITYRTVPNPEMVASDPESEGEVITVAQAPQQIVLTLNPATGFDEQTMQGMSLQFRTSATSTEAWDPATDFDFKVRFTAEHNENDGPEVIDGTSSLGAKPSGAGVTATGQVKNDVAQGFDTYNLETVTVTWTEPNWSGGIAFAFGVKLPDNSLDWKRVVSSDPILQVGAPRPAVARGTGYWGTNGSSIQLTAVWSVEDTGDLNSPITVNCNFGAGTSTSTTVSAQIPRGSDDAIPIQSPNQNQQPRLDGTVTAQWSSDNRSYIVLFSGTVVQSGQVRVSSNYNRQGFSGGETQPMLVAAYIAS